jgi:predicted DNA-binding WGR domain protein
MKIWLYRKNNAEQPYRWSAELNANKTYITVQYGIVGKATYTDSYKVTQKDADKELLSRYNEKRKQGYIDITEIKDNAQLPPVEDEQARYAYLAAYLPSYRNNQNNGNILPMLAKTYTGNVWKKTSCMLGQWKINGLRCFITAYKGDTIFNPVRLRFQSREGIVWNTLTALEDYLFDSLSADIIQNMLDDNWALDGEIYLPGYNVNEINHFVKDPNDIHNKLLQFWCYDIAIPEMVQHKRDRIRLDIKPFSVFDSKDKHLNNKKQLVILPTYHICNDADAHAWRDKFIDLGFEGLILRNPDVDYQYGRRRVGYMEKFKTKTDGKFEIVDIQPERKRNLPIITCRNDINDSTFETRFSMPHDKQEYILNHKEDYIGKFVFISYGERSGVEKVPFHIKEVSLIDAEV